MASTALAAADGRWPEILCALADINADQLTDRHQPCPACGGDDRFRWDRDDGPGGWYCNQCGGKDGRGGGGTGIDLLLRCTGWSFAEAAVAIERHLGIPSTNGHHKPSPAPRRSVIAAAPARPGRPHRQPEVPPPGTPPPPLDGATVQYRYGPADAAITWFYIQRVDSPDGSKRFRHRVWLDGRWHLPNARRDGFSCEWPAPRPLYRLPDLAENTDLPVIVVEGEKAVLAAEELFPGHVIVSWANGAKALRTVDWSPLAGRTVTIWPDADDAGRDCMLRLGPILIDHGATVSIVEPPIFPDIKGWDLADADSVGWSAADAHAWLEQNSRPLKTPPPPPPDPDPDPDRSPPPTPSGDPPPIPFACLGFDDGAYFYQPATTGQVIRLARSAHTSTNLLALAPLSFWETCFAGKTGPNWTAAASHLFELQARSGVYSPERIRGRGAWIDRGRSILHLGDRLIVDRVTHPVTSPPASRFNYQRLASIDIPDGLSPLTDQEGHEIIDIASRFHWEVPASGILLAGWVALAPICGSLTWRPHIWLTAAAGSGKSAILDRFIGPLLDSLALWPEGNTSEAAIRQVLRADALPVVFDEAESNERRDKERIQNILTLARVASSQGRGFIGKGSADGHVQRFTMRSMFFLCSIATALRHGADLSRFAQLSLRPPSSFTPQDRIDHWTALDRDLADHITTDTGHRLLLRSVDQIPNVRESITIFRRVASHRFDSARLGDQYGTLLAGAWSLTSEKAATESDAHTLIDQNDWQQYREASDAPDEHRCLHTLLDHPLRIEGDRGGTLQRSIAELLQIASAGVQSDHDISPTTARAHLGRIGIRVEAEQITLANTAKGIARIMADTPWADCWSDILVRLPGAMKVGATRFQHLGRVSRGVCLDIAAATAA
jgi:putative DNA primase/helicase